MVLRNDLTGRKISKLLVIKFLRKGEKGRAIYLCQCDCGKFKEIRQDVLTSKRNVKSCGCLKKLSAAEVGKKTKKHGHSWRNKKSTPTYSSWRAMIQRCLNKKNKAYSRYGGNGISICERWENFENFLKDMGERPAGKTLDRINNKDGYNPDNCRWATIKEQSENRRFPTSKNKNVGTREIRGKFYVRSCHQHIGVFKTQKEANEAYHKFILERRMKNANQ